LKTNGNQWKPGNYFALLLMWHHILFEMMAGLMRTSQNWKNRVTGCLVNSWWLVFGAGQGGSGI